jgi:hypothetical protein
MNLDQREILMCNQCNCVFGTERHLVKAKSMTNMSSPTSAGGLPCTDNKKRREKKNTENANIRNIAEKISDRKKVLLTAFRKS